MSTFEKNKHICKNEFQSVSLPKILFKTCGNENEHIEHFQALSVILCVLLNYILILIYNYTSLIKLRRIAGTF